MFKSKLAIILFSFWIAAGCQHTSIQTTSEQHIQLKTDVSDTTQSIESEKKDACLTTGEAEAETKDSITIPELPLHDTIVADPEISTSEKETPEPDLTAQEKIDQALELCNFAQQMWEEGKIELALTNLDSAYYSILEIDLEINPEFNQQKEDIRFLISKRILEIYASRRIVANGQHNEIPITLNKYVQDEIKRFTGPERQFFIQSLERSERFRPFILSELKKAGLPEDLSWLPLIESGFKIRALSPARALGLWQFIPSTGYKFGLNRDYYVDERLDPEKSTLAAISYLKELHNLFGDWTTALAAYNCGESRVLRTIRKQSINYLDNFWDLYQKLPRETSRYVPRFLATLHIVNNLDKYNIKITQPLLPINFKICEMTKQVRLKDIAKELDINVGVLKDLNPELRYALLPTTVYPIKIPEDKVELFLSKIDTIKTTYSPPPMYVFHRVGRGETLSGIAKKYKTSMGAISTANNIGKHHTIIAGKVLKIPSRATGIDLGSLTIRSETQGRTITYRVQQGDNLWNIAEKFKTTTKTIMAANKLSGTTLNIGQTLHISTGKQSTEKKNGAATYKVQSGDCPFSIANKYNMSLNRLLALNHLDKRSKIFPGQNLIVE